MEKGLKDLTSAIWNNKKNTSDAYTLGKLLHVLHLLNYKDAFYMEFNRAMVVHDIFHYTRHLIRKAYYNLGNFYFGSKFEKSIFYYKMALVYGSVSPFFDYVWYEGHMYKTSINFVNDVYDAILDGSRWSLTGTEKAKAEEQAAFLKTFYKNTKPWWKALDSVDSTLDLSENAISNLYTPQRLLQLPLDAWPQEPVNEAPCYYITYNMACAFSRLKKREALDWLKVALLMNDK